MTPGDPVAITRGARVLFRAVVDRIAWPGGDIILTDVRRIDGRAVLTTGFRKAMPLTLRAKGRDGTTEHRPDCLRVSHRHTFASVLAGAGVTELVIGAIVGHAGSTTRDTYIDPASLWSAMVEAVGKIPPMGRGSINPDERRRAAGVGE